MRKTRVVHTVFNEGRSLCVSWQQNNKKGHHVRDSDGCIYWYSYLYIDSYINICMIHIYIYMYISCLKMRDLTQDRLRSMHGRCEGVWHVILFTLWLRVRWHNTSPTALMLPCAFSFVFYIGLSRSGTVRSSRPQRQRSYGPYESPRCWGGFCFQRRSLGNEGKSHSKGCKYAPGHAA